MNITLALICICSSTSGLKLTDCTNVVASKYFRWQDLGQAVGGVVGINSGHQNSVASSSILTVLFLTTTWQKPGCPRPGGCIPHVILGFPGEFPLLRGQ